MKRSDIYSLIKNDNGVKSTLYGYELDVSMNEETYREALQNGLDPYLELGDNSLERIAKQYLNLDAFDVNQSTGFSPNGETIKFGIVHFTSATDRWNEPDKDLDSIKGEQTRMKVYLFQKRFDNFKEFLDTPELTRMFCIFRLDYHFVAVTAVKENNMLKSIIVNDSTGSDYTNRIKDFLEALKERGDYESKLSPNLNIVSSQSNIQRILNRDVTCGPRALVNGAYLTQFTAEELNQYTEELANKLKLIEAEKEQLAKTDTELFPKKIEAQLESRLFQEQLPQDLNDFDRQKTFVYERPKTYEVTLKREDGTPYQKVMSLSEYKIYLNKEYEKLASMRKDDEIAYIEGMRGSIPDITCNRFVKMAKELYFNLKRNQQSSEPTVTLNVIRENIEHSFRQLRNNIILQREKFNSREYNEFFIRFSETVAVLLHQTESYKIENEKILEEHQLLFDKLSDDFISGKSSLSDVTQKLDKEIQSKINSIPKLCRDSFCERLHKETLNLIRQAGLAYECNPEKSSKIDLALVMVNIKENLFLHHVNEGLNEIFRTTDHRDIEVLNQKLGALKNEVFGKLNEEIAFLNSISNMAERYITTYLQSMDSQNDNSGLRHFKDKVEDITNAYKDHKDKNRVINAINTAFEEFLSKIPNHQPGPIQIEQVIDGSPNRDNGVVHGASASSRTIAGTNDNDIASASRSAIAGTDGSNIAEASLSATAGTDNSDISSASRSAIAGTDDSNIAEASLSATTNSPVGRNNLSPQGSDPIILSEPKVNLSFVDEINNIKAQTSKVELKVFSDNSVSELSLLLHNSENHKFKKGSIILIGKAAKDFSEKVTKNPGLSQKEKYTLAQRLMKGQDDSSRCMKVGETENTSNILAKIKASELYLKSGEKLAKKEVGTTIPNEIKNRKVSFWRDVNQMLSSILSSENASEFNFSKLDTMANEVILRRNNYKQDSYQAEKPTHSKGIWRNICGRNHPSFGDLGNHN